MYFFPYTSFKQCSGFKHVGLVSKQCKFQKLVMHYNLNDTQTFSPWHYLTAARERKEGDRGGSLAGTKGHPSYPQIRLIHQMWQLS